jgi:peptide-methionine (R)-S-oxide reductase
VCFAFYLGAAYIEDMKTLTKQNFSRRALLIGAAGTVLAACSGARNSSDKTATASAEADLYADSKWRTLTEADWKEALSPKAFNVMRQDGTERAFTSPLNDESRAGAFHCAGCDLPLFESNTKYDSGTGWPSFYDVIPGAVATSEDTKLFYTRTEYHCARCLSHQGHVFDDGPAPTGLRYCNNGVALTFMPT